jgi:hypothetical protein
VGESLSLRSTCCTLCIQHSNNSMKCIELCRTQKYRGLSHKKHPAVSPFGPFRSAPVLKVSSSGPHEGKEICGDSIKQTGVADRVTPAHANSMLGCRKAHHAHVLSNCTLPRRACYASEGSVLCCEMLNLVSRDPRPRKLVGSAEFSHPVIIRIRVVTIGRCGPQKIVKPRGHLHVSSDSEARHTSYVRDCQEPCCIYGPGSAIYIYRS